MEYPKRTPCAETVEIEREQFFNRLDEASQHNPQEKSMTVRLDFGLASDVETLCEFYKVSRQTLLEKLIRFEVETVLSGFSEEVLHGEFKAIADQKLDEMISGGGK